jgi:hypothetical protein
VDIQRGVQSVFRAANERLRAHMERRETIDPRPVICECSDTSCMQVLEVSCSEYEGVRRQGHFMVAAGHDTPEIERVVEERDGYAVVDKD